jgi:ribonuclease P protein component
MLARLIHKPDFERLMSAPMRSRSAHFALHYLARSPHPAMAPAPRPAIQEISTELSRETQPPVDNSPTGVWIGAIVPKRHARRAVTRTLLKRQIREAFQRHEAALSYGLWLVRLRRGFLPAEFVSARSEALAAAARSELEDLLQWARPGRAR